jgi:hypothetical protein
MEEGRNRGPGGRPTNYRPEYCERVIEMGRHGFSVAQMASQLGTSKQTLLRWVDANPEFRDAMEIARSHSQAWWEAMGQANLVMPKDSGTFQGSVWSRSMAARFPDDWRENKGVELTGANGGPIETKSTVTMTPEEAYKRMLG